MRHKTSRKKPQLFLSETQGEVVSPRKIERSISINAKKVKKSRKFRIFMKFCGRIQEKKNRARMKVFKFFEF
jgi:hypothetical protein